MARKDKSWAGLGFGDAASFSEQNETKQDENTNINVNVNKNVELTEKTVISTILEEKKKEEQKVLNGLYLDKDVSKVLDKVGKKLGRGGKSKIANEALRKIFIEGGLL